MLDALKNVLSRAAEDSDSLTYNEDATKLSIVLPALQSLGWTIFDPAEVTPEYSVGTKRVDFALRIQGQNKVFLEIKRCSADLERHQEQLLNYSFQQGVRLAILTNGIVWWFYLPLREGAWEQRKFYSIDLKQRAVQDIASRLVDFLSKANVESGKAIENAETVLTSRKRKYEVDQTLPKAWRDLTTAPDQTLLELLKDKVEQLCGFSPTDDEVSHFLTETAVRNPRPLSPRPQPTPSPRPKLQPEDPVLRNQVLSLQQLMNQDLRRTKPSALLLDGQEIHVKNWAGVSTSFVRWLIEHGQLERRHLPIRTFALGDRYYINTHPVHQNPKLGGVWNEVKGGFHVDVNFSAKDHVRNVKSTLEQLGLVDLNVRVSLR